MDFKPKNREWVKNAAIAFLAVLLALTFFSNTIMNRTLAEAATANVTSGSIVAKVRGSGKVVANGTHEVKADQTREVRSVMVKVGQEVNAGDVLFIMGAGDSKELETAKDTLRELQYSYQKSAVSMPNFDYSSYNKTIDEASIAADKAWEAYLTASNAADKAEKTYKDMMKTAGTSEQSIQEYQEQLEKCRASLEISEADYNAAMEDFNARLSTARDRVQKCQSRYDMIYEAIYGPIQTPTPAPPTEAPAESTMAPAPELDPAPALDPEPAANPEPSADTGGGAEALADLGLELQLASLAEGGNGTYTEADLAAAKAELDAANAALIAMNVDTDPYVSMARALYEKDRKAYDALLAQENSIIPYEIIPYKTAYEAEAAQARVAYEAFEAAEKNLDYAYEALANAQTSNGKTSTLASIDLQQIAEKIKIQQDKIKELAGEEGNQVVAKVSGTVDSIACTAGDTVAADALMCTIEVPDMGYTLSFSVTNDQAQRLRVGDTATVSNYYWGKEIVATLTTMRNDPKNPQSNKLLTFELEGDVSSGSELTISVGSKSATYDTIIPNSAIRSDTNGSFVLAVTAKNSPLGNRYIAKRVSVEVVASDDENSAVTGGLNNGDYVITTTSAPVKDGDMVRMADSAT